MTGHWRLPAVNGPTAPLSVGAIVDGHAHAWLISPGIDPGLPRLADHEAIVGELTAFSRAGGAAVVDCQPGRAGRDAGRLAELSKQSGVAIVACTGYHLDRYYADHESPWCRADLDAVEQLWRDELMNGAEEAPEACIGFIKAADPGDRCTDRAKELFEIAMRVARDSGAPLLIHTEQGLNIESLVGRIGGAELDPRSVQLCHIDKRPDVALHLDLASAGFRLGYDTFCRPKYDPANNVFPLIEALLAGSGRLSICLGLDLADSSLWAFSGGPGLTYLTDYVVPTLRRLGVDHPTIDAITGTNAMDWLAPQESVAA